MTKPFISSFPADYDRKSGGLLGLTAAGLSIVAATYGLARYCFGLFLPEIRLEYSLSSETIGLIAALSYAGYLLATFAGSWLSTRHGPRLPVFLGGMAATIGMTTIGLSTDTIMLAVGVFVAGMSPGLAYPPFSDVVVHHVTLPRQNSVYAWINSGTGFGVALAGPLALFAGENWRLNWLVFAGLALLFTLWNVVVLPKSQHHSRNAAVISVAGILTRFASPLFTSALSFGIVTSIYWTFAVDLLWSLTGNPRDAIVFWIVLGAAGVSGCFAGGLVNKWGLRRSYLSLMVLVGTAIGSLPAIAQLPSGIYYSAACFGAGFIIATALFGMWSMRIFRKTPSIGFGITFFLISLGQGIGPVIAGYLEPAIGMPAIFFGAGLFCILLAAVRPPAQQATPHN